jgi:hypothetical protein
VTGTSLSFSFLFCIFFSFLLIGFFPDLDERREKLDHMTSYCSRSLPTRFPRVAHSLPTRCPRVAHSLPTRCPRVAHSLPTRYPRVTHALPTRCPRVAHALPTRCPRVAHSLPTRNLLVAHSLPCKDLDNDALSWLGNSHRYTFWNHYETVRTDKTISKTT